MTYRVFPAVTLLAAALAMSPGAALADTTEVTWQTRVVVEKSAAHCADDPN